MSNLDSFSLLRCTDIGWGGGASVGGIKKKRGPRDKQAHGQNIASTRGMWNLRYNSGPPGVAPTLTKLPSVGIC